MVKVYIFWKEISQGIQKCIQILSQVEANQVMFIQIRRKWYLKHVSLSMPYHFLWSTSNKIIACYFQKEQASSPQPF